MPHLIKASVNAVMPPTNRKQHRNPPERSLVTRQSIEIHGERHFQTFPCLATGEYWGKRSLANKVHRRNQRKRKQRQQSVREGQKKKKAGESGIHPKQALFAAINARW